MAEQENIDCSLTLERSSVVTCEEMYSEGFRLQLRVTLERFFNTFRIAAAENARYGFSLTASIKPLLCADSGSAAKRDNSVSIPSSTKTHQPYSVGRQEVFVSLDQTQATLEDFLTTIPTTSAVQIQNRKEVQEAIAMIGGLKRFLAPNG